MWSWKDCTSQNYMICSASDCFIFVRSRNRSKQWTDTLFTIEDICETSHWSDDENSNLQGRERNSGKRISHEEFKRKESLRRKESRRMFPVEAHGERSKRYSCSFSHDELAQGLLLHQTRRPRLTQGGIFFEIKNRPLQTKGVKLRAITGFVKARHVNFGILPYVKTTSLRPDANMATNAIFDMLRQMKSPAKSQRKMVQRISCFVEGVHTIGLCISRFLSEKIIYST